MGDVFKEQIIKKVQTTKELLLKAAVILAAVLIALVLSSIKIVLGFFPVVVLVLGFLTYYLLSFFNMEYEYILTNGELDIDVIYNRSRRKRVFSGMAKDFELFGKADSKGFGGEGGMVLKNYASGRKASETYAFIAMIAGKKTKVIIEPNEEMTKMLLTFIPSRKIIK